MYPGSSCILTESSWMPFPHEHFPHVGKPQPACPPLARSRCWEEDTVCHCHYSKSSLTPCTGGVGQEQLWGSPSACIIQGKWQQGAQVLPSRVCSWSVGYWMVEAGSWCWTRHPAQSQPTTEVRQELFWGSACAWFR